MKNEWYEIAVSYTDEGGTESIGFISLPEDDNGGDCPTLKSELMDVLKRINHDFINGV